MAGELDKYIQQFQEYVKNSGISVKKPEKPVFVNKEEEKAVEKVIQEVQKPTSTIVVKHFDEDSFDAKVMADVKGRYGVINKCTIAYEASDKGSVTHADSLLEVKEFYDYLVPLYELCFAEIWGYGYVGAQDSLEEKGCPTCTGEYAKCGGFSNLASKARYQGMQYYTSLRNFERVMKQREEVKMLLEQKFNYKKSLPDWACTFTRIGGLAYMWVK